MTLVTVSNSITKSFLPLLVCFLAILIEAQGQDQTINCSDTIFCVPGVIGMPRSKGLVMSREQVLDYSIRSNSKQDYLANGSGEVRTNRRYQFKLRAPLVMKKNIKVAMGFDYFVEEYRFEDLNQLDYPLYVSLEDKSLKSIGSTVYVVKPFRGNRYFLFRGSASLNGDYGTKDLPTIDYLRFSLSPLYGVKRNDRVSYAFGAAFSYNFGRPAIYPVFAYNKTFNPHWGVEALLPARVWLRYTYNDRNLVYAKVGFNGASYNIQLKDPSLVNKESLHLEKSELRYLITYEREIYDFLWVGMEAGMRSNLEFSLTDVDGSQRDLLINNRLNHAFLFNFSVFIVPPRNMLN